MIELNILRILKQASINKHILIQHTHLTAGPLSGTARVSRYQKGKTSLDLTEARNSEWQWHQLDHKQTICTSLQTGNHTNTSLLNFCRPGALPDALVWLTQIVLEWRPLSGCSVVVVVVM